MDFSIIESSRKDFRLTILGSLLKVLDWHENVLSGTKCKYTADADWQTIRLLSLIGREADKAKRTFDRYCALGSPSVEQDKNTKETQLAMHGNEEADWCLNIQRRDVSEIKSW